LTISIWKKLNFYILLSRKIWVSVLARINWIRAVDKICVEQLFSCKKCRAIACRAIAIWAVHPHSYKHYRNDSYYLICRYESMFQIMFVLCLIYLYTFLIPTMCNTFRRLSIIISFHFDYFVSIISISISIRYFLCGNFLWVTRLHFFRLIVK